jgi:hypothetical protein
MSKQRLGTIASFGVGALLLLSAWLGATHETAQAATSITLSVQPAAQRLVTPIGGDDGLWDCLPASVYMALRYLQTRGGGAATSYETVRAAFRAGVAADTALSPWLAQQLVSSLSGGAQNAVIAFTSAADWQSWLAAQLRAGTPVIPFISNWLLLSPADHPTAEAGETVALAHAIVISGLHNGQVIYQDPWDGKTHSLPASEFAQAWAPSWGAIVIQPAA